MLAPRALHFFVGIHVSVRAAAIAAAVGATASVAGTITTLRIGAGIVVAVYRLGGGLGGSGRGRLQESLYIESGHGG
jgi:ABC-type uncharacterized transport system YnjBCD permease subunit